MTMLWDHVARVLLIRAANCSKVVPAVMVSCNHFTLQACVSCISKP